jgi:hypothetical protein
MKKKRNLKKRITKKSLMDIFVGLVSFILIALLNFAVYSVAPVS